MGHLTPPLRPYTRPWRASSARGRIAAAGRFAASVAVALTLGGCAGGPSSVTIAPVSYVERVALTEAGRAWFGAELDALAPGLRIEAAATDVQAVAAVRAGGGAALVADATGAVAAGLAVTEVATLPIALTVPFSFPVEGLAVADARAVVAGRTRSWRDVGGPPERIEVLRIEGDARALGTEVLGTVLSASGAPVLVRGQVLVGDPATGGGLTKTLRIDGLLPGDDGYPFVARWVMVSRADDARSVALARAVAARVSGAGADVLLAAVGDIMLDREVGRLIAARGARAPFEAAIPALAGADIRLANLELPLTERGQPATKDYVFRAPPSAVEGLAAAGFSVLTLANNHAMDYGADGLLDTLAALDRAGIARVGGGRNADAAHAPALLTVRGLRIAVLSYVNTPNDSRTGWQAESVKAGSFAPGVAWGEAEAVRRDVTAARASADVVIVAMHAGFEYTAAPNPVQRAIAYAAIDAGAALVIGAHPHVLQGIERYKTGTIIYSLGNFVFDADDDDRRQPGMPSLLSAVLRVRLGREGVRSLELLPMLIDATDGRPVPVSGAAARPVYERVYSLTDALAGGR